MILKLLAFVILTNLARKLMSLYSIDVMAHFLLNRDICVLFLAYQGQLIKGTQVVFLLCLIYSRNNQ